MKSLKKQPYSTPEIEIVYMLEDIIETSNPGDNDKDDEWEIPGQGGWL